MPRGEFNIYLLLIVLFGAVIRLSFLLTNQTLYGDEFDVFDISRLPFSQIITGDYWDFPIHPPLVYLLIKAWSYFSLNETWLRAPSFFASVLSIPVIYFLGNELFKNIKISLIASFIFAFLTFNVRFAAEAKFYIILLFLEVLSLLFFTRILNRITNNIRTYDLLFFIIFSFFALMTDYSFFFLLVVYFLFVLISLSKKRNVIEIKNYYYLLISLVIVAGLFLPWVFKFTSTLKDAFHAVSFYINRPDLASIPQNLLSIITFYGERNDITRNFMESIKHLPLIEKFYTLMNYLILVFLGYTIYSEKIKGGKPLLLGLILGVPIALSFVVSQFSPILIDYKIMIVQVPIIFLFAKFIFGKGKLRLGFLLLLFFLNLLTFSYLFKTGFPKYYYPGMHEYLNHEIKMPAIMIISPEHTEYVLNYIDAKKGRPGYKFKSLVLGNKQTSLPLVSYENFKSVCFFLRPGRANRNVTNKILEKLKTMDYSSYIDRWVGAYYLNCYEK